MVSTAVRIRLRRPACNPSSVLEHLFDDDKEAHAYAVIDDLLDKTDEASASLVSLLALARFVLFSNLRVNTLDRLSQHIERLHSDLPDRRPDDDSPVSDLWAEAEARNYADSEKLALVQTCFARKNSLEKLEEFLYLSATDVPERYRHKNYQDPWRGELQLARRQLNALLRLFDQRLSTEREARIISYQSVVRGELNSGGRWRSQRDPQDLPDTDFMSASKNYLSAAHAIEPIDTNRYVKYLSRACRHLATGTRRQQLGPCYGWETSRLIHKQATELLTDIAQSVDESDKLLETITGSVTLHTFWSHQAAASAAFNHRNAEAIQEEISAAWEHVDNTPTYVKTDLLDTLKNLSEALILEDEGYFEDAVEIYKEIKDSRINLSQRIALAEIKDHIDSERYDAAIEQAEAVFKEDSPITAAVVLISGDYVSSVSVCPPMMEELRAVDPTVKWPFVFYTFLATGPPDGKSAVVDGIRELLLRL